MLLIGCEEGGYPDVASPEVVNFRNGQLRVARFIREQMRAFDFEGMQRFDAEYEGERRSLEADEERFRREAMRAKPPEESNKPGHGSPL